MEGAIQLEMAMTQTKIRMSMRSVSGDGKDDDDDDDDDDDSSSNNGSDDPDNDNVSDSGGRTKKAPRLRATKSSIFKQNHRRKSSLDAVRRATFSPTRQGSQKRDLQDEGAIAHAKGAAADADHGDGVETIESLEIAAYAHLQQWVKNAELCHRVLKAATEGRQQVSHEVDCLMIFCGCCFGGCCRCHRCRCRCLRFNYSFRCLWRTCPGGYCCTKGKQPALPSKRGAFAAHGFPDAQRVEQKYPLCCCGPRVFLRLSTAPFLW